MSTSIGVGARKLRDRDWLSKSDAYLVISKPSTSGGFTVLRKSETKKNSHNPDWNDFLFSEHELNPQDLDLKLRFEVMDNDYGCGDDQKLGTAFLSLRQLEAAALIGTKMPLGDCKGNVRSSGHLVVRTFSRHQGHGGGYQGQGGAYPADNTSHLGQNTDYSGQRGATARGYLPPGNLPYHAQPAQGMPGVYYPPKGQKYPPQGQSYPPQGHAFPQQGQAYPPQGQAYPPQGQAYPPQGHAYPPQGQAYPPKGQAYPPQGHEYPGPYQSSPYPPQNGAYPPTIHAYPPLSSGHYPPPNGAYNPPTAPPLPSAPTNPAPSYPTYPTSPTYNSPSSGGAGGFRKPGSLSHF